MNTKIKIIIPDKNDPFKIQVGSSSVKRKNIMSAYGYVERKVSKLLASGHKTKIDVIVDYATLHQKDKTEWINEGTYDNTNEAMYALTCFLEDYISFDYARDKYRKYNQNYI